MRQEYVTLTKSSCLAAVCALLLSGCALPSLKDRNETRVLSQQETSQTSLGKAVSKEVQQHQGEAGYVALADPLEAFASRVKLADAAERTLDIQYYIWSKDITGTLLLDAVHRAAERGVRVRLLVDDNGIPGMDQQLAALNKHPNVEVRLYNPFVIRIPKWLNYVVAFPRLNHRMHNKSFTADNQVSIVGGRNIGDEYFGTGHGVIYADLDLAVVGRVVNVVSQSFQLYWTSESAYPAERILRDVDESGEEKIGEELNKQLASKESSTYVDSLRRSQLVSRLTEGKLQFHWAPMTLVSDDPAKTVDKADDSQLLIGQLPKLMGSPQHKVNLVSAYFVPTQSGVDTFKQLTDNGVDVSILTNSLQATDVTAVHSGYARWRPELLRDGSHLFELKPAGGSDNKTRLSGPFGKSTSSLHAKTFTADGKRVFVGSFNFDPRSARINTEMGFLVDSPHLAEQIDDSFEQQVPYVAYEVKMDSQGKLYWIERNADGSETRYDKEPNAGALKRTAAWFMSFLPIESLL